MGRVVLGIVLETGLECAGCHDGVKAEVWKHTPLTGRAADVRAQAPPVRIAQARALACQVADRLEVI